MPKLPFHEWLIITLFIIVLLLLGIITLFWNNQKLPQISKIHELDIQTIQVCVRGAVKKPGTYELKKGSLLGGLLELAELTSEAELSKMQMNAKLRDGQKVTVPTQKWITVFVEGSGVQSAQLKLKSGTLLNELPDLITFLPEADVGKLQRKRRLKDNEIIRIELKKEKPLKKNIAKKMQRMQEMQGT